MYRKHPNTLRLLALVLISLLICGSVAACDLSPAGTPTATLPSPTAIESPVPPTQPAPTQAPPTSSVAQVTGDGNIDAPKLFHDSRDPFYREPGGAVVAGTGVELRIKTAPGDLTGASVRIWNSRTQTETLVPMSPVGDDTWEASIHTPPEGEALWYRFRAYDGRTTAYYNDDRSHDGGVGEGHGYESQDDYVITAYSKDFNTPDWVRDAVVYQIFPDRFYNGDPNNDKHADSFIYGDKTIARQWGDKPTGGNDFFGGDLRGVIDKLDYLQSLGVTAIYFNPVFTSPSNHRYDTTDYTQIDPSLGDLNTFKELVSKAKAAGIHIILDGVFNHSSSDSLYFDKYSRYDTEGAFEAQSSPYFGWYTFKEWPQKYNSWSGINTLPQFNESDVVKQFLFTGPDSVVKRWMKEGIGGWRLDAAEQKSHDFWRVMREVVKQQDPDAVIIGEYWQNAADWLAGDQWDGVMDYRFRDALLGWLANPARSAQTMANQLASIREDYAPQALAASMNLIDSHDTARALTDAGDDKNMLYLMALLQFTSPGMPTIYYGDEAGLDGAKDPDDRRTYPWGSEDQSLLSFYKMLAKVRHSTSALQVGDYVDLLADNKLDVYTFARKDSDGMAIIALNRSHDDHDASLQVNDIAHAGQVFEDQMNTGSSYTVAEDGTLTIKVPARWGVLLLAK